MSQEVRNAIYGVAAALVPILVVLGWITPEDGDQILGWLNTALGLAVAAIGLFVAVMAFIKSRTATTTTIDVPKATVVEVVTTAGNANVDSDSNPVG